MSRFIAGSKAAERRLRKHAEALAKLSTITAQRQQADTRLTAQEAARHAAEEDARAMQAEAEAIRHEFIGPRMPLEERAARFDAEQAAKNRKRPIATIVRQARTAREERAAEAKPTPAPMAAPTSTSTSTNPCPVPIRSHQKTRQTQITLHARSAGWWDVVAATEAGSITLPFYQPERPEPQEIAQAVREEITRRLAVSQPKPRSTKAPAMPGQQPRETARIRRIERQLEGV